MGIPPSKHTHTHKARAQMAWRANDAKSVPGVPIAYSYRAQNAHPIRAKLRTE